MIDSFSYLTHLECSNCQKHFEFAIPQTFCPDCIAPIFARYNLTTVREHFKPNDFKNRSRGMWRWHEFLPVINAFNIVYLGEGDTPLLRLAQLGKYFGMSNLYLKDESFNPTGTFKARGISSAVSKAQELGIKKLIIPSAGNAGGALAAYASRGCLDACIVMPQNSPKANILESRITGATVELIEGLINDAANFVKERMREDSWFDVSTFKEPYRVEGKKIMGYELAEYFDWNLPDVIVYPTGGGTGLVGMYKAFIELQNIGWIRKNHLPRMVAIQAEGCAPIVRAFETSKTYCDFWENAKTIATGLCVPKSFADRLIIQYLHHSGGTALSVSDNEIVEAQKRLAEKEGIFAAPEGAATLAGLIKLIDDGWVDPNDKIVIFNTGTGLKYVC